jgi:hypothetical protein
VTHRFLLARADKQFKAIGTGFICKWDIKAITVQKSAIALKLESVNGWLILSGTIKFPRSHHIASDVLAVVESDAIDKVLPRVLVLAVFGLRNKYFYLEY